MGGRIGPGDRPSDASRVRAFYDEKARSYDRWLTMYERVTEIGPRRQRLLSLAQGRVLEVGVGTGRSLPGYPAETQITGVDISPAMLQIAWARASGLGRAADLRLGDAQALDFPDDAFDTVVAILVLSAVPDQRQALREIKRVLRPEGRLLVLDHGRSPVRIVGAMQRVLDPLLRRFARWQFRRDLAEDISSAGFEIEDETRSKLGLTSIVARR